MNGMGSGAVKRYCVLLSAVLAIVTGPPSLAQDAAEAPPPAEEERPAPPPAAEEETRTLEEIFIPSEEIGADEEVTFPIDI
jgi:hypothetical protein